MPAKGWQTCDVTAEAFLWQVDRDPQFSGFGLLVATFFMLLSDSRRDVQSTRCHPFTLHHGQAWRRISGWEGDAPVILQGVLKPSPYRKNLVDIDWILQSILFCSKLKKITACCAADDLDLIFVGTDAGNIHRFEVATLKLSDKVICRESIVHRWQHF